ncbi:GGDEF domain-containing protein [Photobacterium damselae]|uniref:GGDEF domain-containing protein n=1 Tax=Photobacterium damselae TaxID=38293 RepID=UPI00370C6638
MTNLLNVASEISELKQRLDQAQLNYRDQTFKSRRELTILKRLISRLIEVCIGLDSELDRKLLELKAELEQPKEITQLIPRLAVIERLVILQAEKNKKSSHQLQQQFQHSGEALTRFGGLPAPLKRDVLELMQQSTQDRHGLRLHVSQLLALYQRALTLKATTKQNSELSVGYCQQLQQLSAELMQLTTEVDVSGETFQQLQTIQHQLLQDIEPDKLIEMALTVLQMELKHSQKQRKQSQHFINQLHGDLAAAHKNTQHSHEQFHYLHQQRQTVNVELSDITATLTNNLQQQNLETLRPVFEQLAQELKILTERNQALEKREQTIIEQLNYSGNKLQLVLDQTETYHQQLEDEEQRLYLDPLTQLHNQAALRHRLEQEFQRWIRYQNTTVVAIIDLNRFKKINELYGYGAGDKALKIIAKSLRSHLQSTDFIARSHGDEFVIILPDTTKDQAHKILEQIQNNTQNLPFRFRQQGVTITTTACASVISAQYSPDELLQQLKLTVIQYSSDASTALTWL